MNIQNDTVIKILFLAANPIDKPPLRIDREFRAVDEALQRADFSKKFDIRYYGAAQIGDLQEQLLQHKPHIVHFSGHGNTSSEIILEDDNRNARPVTQNALRQLFTLLKDNIKCVVLNACYSASQAAAIAESIDCVIGISDAIDDEASILFASAFYRALGDGRDVKKAFDLSCNRLNLEDYEEHNKPQILAPRLNPSHLYFVNQEPNQVTPPIEDLQSNRASHFKLDDSPIFTEQIIEILSEALEPISISDIVDILQILPSEARKVINFLDDYIILDDRGFFCPFSQGMKNQWKLVLGSHDRPNLLSSWCKKYQRWGWRDNTPTYVFNHCATHFEQDRDTAALLGLIDQKYIEQKFARQGCYAGIRKDFNIIIQSLSLLIEPNWPQFIQACLIQSTLTTFSKNLSPSVLGSLAYIGHLDQAFADVSLIPDIDHQADCYLAIMHGIIAKGELERAMETPFEELLTMAKIFDKRKLPLNRYSQTLHDIKAYLQILTRSKETDTNILIQTIREFCETRHSEHNFVLFALFQVLPQDVKNLNNVELLATVNQLVRQYGLRTDWLTLPPNVN